MSVESNLALANTIYNHFSNDAFDQVLEHATEDVNVVYIPAGQTFTGHDGFRQFMQGFKMAMPDLRINLTNQVATNTQVVSEFIARGTHTGPLPTPAGEIPATGRTAEWPVCEVWEIRDGKLAVLRNYQDSATLMRQLGLL